MLKPHPKFSAKQKELFLSRIDENGPNGCHIWMGNKNNNGYGVAYGNSADKVVRGHYAHRVMMSITGKLKKGKMVLHSCNNPACVNPEHLRCGTHADNMIDRQIAGNTAKGELQGLSVLKARHIPVIFALYKSGMTKKEIARIFKVSAPTIALVINRKTWNHIQI